MGEENSLEDQSIQNPNMTDSSSVWKKERMIQNMRFKNIIDDSIAEPMFQLDLDYDYTNERYESFGNLSPRIIFGVSSKKELNKWLILINYIISRQKNVYEGMEDNLHQQSWVINTN